MGHGFFISNAGMGRDELVAAMVETPSGALLFHQVIVLCRNGLCMHM